MSRTHPTHQLATTTMCTSTMEAMIMRLIGLRTNGEMDKAIRRCLT